MGLDMYLTKKIYVGAEHEHRNVTGTIDIKVGDTPLNINFNKVSYIEEKAGYWRKANAIHKWFVDNVQDGEDDCHEYWVSRDDLQNLLEICNQVLAASTLIDGVVANGKTMVGGELKTNYESGKMIENPEVANELLPTASGFFFGGTDYDEYYYQDVVDTKRIIEEALKGEDGDYYYQSSW